MATDGDKMDPVRTPSPSVSPRSLSPRSHSPHTPSPLASPSNPLQQGSVNQTNPSRQQQQLQLALPSPPQLILSPPTPPAPPIVTQPGHAVKKTLRERLFRPFKAKVSAVGGEGAADGTGEAALDDIIEGVTCVSYGNYYTVSGTGANALHNQFKQSYYLVSGPNSGPPAAAQTAEQPKAEPIRRRFSSALAPVLSAAAPLGSRRRASDTPTMEAAKKAAAAAASPPRSSGASLTTSTGMRMKNFFGVMRQRSQSVVVPPNLAPPPTASDRRRAVPNRETKTVVSRGQKKFKVTPSLGGNAGSKVAPEVPVMKVGPDEFFEMYRTRTRTQSDSKSALVGAARAAARSRKEVLLSLPTEVRQRRCSDTTLHQMALANAARVARVKYVSGDSPFNNYQMLSEAAHMSHATDPCEGSTAMRLIVWKDKDIGTRIYRVFNPGAEIAVHKVFGGNDSEDLIFARYLHDQRCYALMPNSSKLVVFDTNLTVKRAFYALVENNLRAAPLWDTEKQDFVGMLTVTDFIQILQQFYSWSQEKKDEMENQKISTWKDYLHKTDAPLVCVHPEDTVLAAVRTLRHHRFHRLLVLNPDTGNALHVLTYKRILRFLLTGLKGRQLPAFMSRTLEELSIGTYDDIVTATKDTSVIEALGVFVARRVSALPIVDKLTGRVVDIFAKSDVMGLADVNIYKNLDVSIREALRTRKEFQFEGVQTCHRTETLEAVVVKIVDAVVHRLVIVDSEGRVDGVISLSDILRFLVLTPLDSMPRVPGGGDSSEEETGEDSGTENAPSVETEMEQDAARVAIRSSFNRLSVTD